MEDMGVLESTQLRESILGQMAQNDHEQVVFCHDRATGLKAIIAVHNTVLGPALGGCRMWNYGSEHEALRDVLRLSRGMTYKAAISGLNLGGGKAVIIGDPRKLKNEGLMRRFGKFVESLGGKYITAEDVGMETVDMEYISYETDHVTGIPESIGGSGNPSPVTAYGVYCGMKGAAQHRWQSDDLSKRSVMVQGVGHVGETLVKYLTEEGAKVYVNDIGQERLDHIAKKYGATAVGAEEVYSANVDIYAPCALGATLNDDTIAQLKCSIVAGAANNQLENEMRHGQMLVDQGIVYAPDFVINAGGLINVYAELSGYGKDEAMFRTENIRTTTITILQKAEKEGITPQVAALKAAQERIDAIEKVHSRL